MVVKKYGNRRLYDTTESRYITLEELAQRVRAGGDVQVVDAKTNRDLTQQTLAHIILESRGASKLLPVPLLKQLIRMGDDALAEFFGLYVSGALEMYLRAKQTSQAMMPYNPFAGMPMMAGNAFARLISGWGPTPSPEPPPAPYEPPPPPPDEARDEMAELRRELEEIKQALKGSPRRAPEDEDP